MTIQNRFSRPVNVFRDQRLPVTAAPAGYAALIDACDLNVPLPRTLSAIGERHRLVAQDGWRIYSPRYAPPPSLAGHLTFALKHEGIDLAVLKRFYAASGPAPVEALVRAAPTGAYALSRRGRTREFAALTGAEIARIETLYREVLLDPEPVAAAGGSGQGSPLS